jgi:uncharacterized protein
MRLALILILLSAATAAGGTAAAAAAAPSPQCAGVPALTGRVVDRAHLISAAGTARLTRELAQLEAATSDQVVVATLPSLGGRSIEEEGLALGRCWGVGRKGMDNGVVVLVAPAEKKVRVEVGYGLEGLLTDERAGAIIERDMLPRLKAGRVEAGIKEGVRAIDALLRSDHRRPQRRTRG